MDNSKDFCALTGIQFPIAQAPIGSAAIPILAAAVSESGALGTLALSWSSPDAVRATIRDMRARTAKPFAINLLLEWPQEDRLRAALDEGVTLVSLAWGDPRPYVKAIHDSGALLLQTVSTADEGKRCVDVGADIIVAQGWEAGGHVRGDVATLALTPAVVDAVAPVPVVAAGGIADGRGLAAVLALGASGAWIGTRFLASVEARAHEVYKHQLLHSNEADTILTNLFEGGWPNAMHRVLKNSTVKRWLEAGSPQPGARPGESDAITFRANGSVIAPYSSSMAVPDMTGDVGALPQYAGQGVALISEILPAADIVDALMRGAREALSGSKLLLGHATDPTA